MMRNAVFLIISEIKTANCYSSSIFSSRAVKTVKSSTWTIDFRTSKIKVQAMRF